MARTIEALINDQQASARGLAGALSRYEVTNSQVHSAGREVSIVLLTRLEECAQRVAFKKERVDDLDERIEEGFRRGETNG